MSESLPECVNCGMRQVVPDRTGNGPPWCRYCGTVQIGRPLFVTYQMADGSLVYGEYEFVTGLEFFEERDDEIRLIKRTYRLISEEEVVLPDPIGELVGDDDDDEGGGDHDPDPADRGVSGGVHQAGPGGEQGTRRGG